MDKKRLFIAIDISKETRAAIDSYVMELRKVRANCVRWEKPEKIHLTLKFLGDTEPAITPEIELAMASIAAGHKAFDLDVEGTGAFPTPRKAKVLWVGLRPNEQLTELHTAVETALEPLGFPKKGRPFRPHLTIARIRDSSQTRMLIDAHLAEGFHAIVSPVNAITLYESKLSQSGSVYSRLRQFPLRRAK